MRIAGAYSVHADAAPNPRNQTGSRLARCDGEILYVRVQSRWPGRGLPQKLLTNGFSNNAISRLQPRIS
jgi:hypothetical protein